MKINIFNTLTTTFFFVAFSSLMHGESAPSLASIIGIAYTLATCLAAISATRLIDNMIQKKLQNAVDTDDLKKMQFYIMLGATINDLFVLLWLLEKGHTQIVVTLIENGANVHATSQDRDTLLHWAAKYGQTPIVLVLIKNGADVHATYQDGETALHWAAKNGQIQAALVLIQAKANVKATNHFGDTPLHNAVRSGHTQTALALIENGANPNAANDNSNTPLHLAAEIGHAETALALIQNGAIICTTNQDGYSPQRCAEEAGQIRTALAIMHAGKALVNSVATVFPFLPNDVAALILQYSGVLHGKKINLDDVVNCRRAPTKEQTPSISAAAGLATPRCT
jgi:ankyrin repeat protein